MAKDLETEEIHVSLVENYFDEPVYAQYDDLETPFHYLAKKDRDKYQDKQIDILRVVYLISVILWLVIIYLAGFYMTDFIGFLILVAPILIFAISFYYLEYSTVEIEKEMFSGNVLSFVFLVVSVLIKWNEITQKRKILLAMTISIVLIMGSLIDIWVPKNRIIVLKHVRSIFNTTALALLIYALYEHYSHALRGLTCGENKIEIPPEDSK